MRAVLLNGSYQSLENLCFLLVRGVYIVVFARILGIELYGQYVYSQNWYLLAMTVAAWGTNELVMAESIRSDGARRAALEGTGLGLRLLLGFLLALLVAGIALVFEPDERLRLLILIYAQGVVVRGVTSWISALFVSRERSQYVLYVNVPFLILEVLVAIVLALNGADLVAIALVQCLVWWLTLIAAWWLYQSKFGPLRPRFTRSYLRYLLSNGSVLALASFLFGWLGPGLLIIYRYFSVSAAQLGEAAFVIQIFAMLSLTIRVVSNTALPQLNRPDANQRQRLGFFALTIWSQSLYLGGAVYIVGYWCLPTLVSLLMGPEFAGAAALLAHFSWLLVPLLLIHGLRLVMISHRMLPGFLLAITVGIVLLAALLLFVLRLDMVSLEALFACLGIAYCAIAATIVGIIQSRTGLFAVSELLVPPAMLAAVLILFRLLDQASPLSTSLLALAPLLVLSLLQLRTYYTRS